MARDSDAMTRGLHVIEPHVSMRLRRHCALTAVQKRGRLHTRLYWLDLILSTITCGRTQALLLSLAIRDGRTMLNTFRAFFGLSGCAVAEFSPQEDEELVLVIVFLITVHLVSENCGR
jgi:hypothetical protein